MPVPSTFRPPLERAMSHALAHLDGLETAPVGATASPAELRARLGRPLADEGTDPARVIDDLVADSAGGILGCAGGRFFGWVVGGALPAALAADWLTSAWDQNAALYVGGPAAAVMEEVAGDWLKALFGLPAGASVGFVTGCQAAHFTCLAAARHKLLADRGWDVEADGLMGAPRIRILTSSEHHGSIARAARQLGLGTRAIIPLGTDAQGRLDLAALDAALRAEPDAPTVVVLNAGDLNIGAFDPFADAIPLARAHGAWAHVDGAFGLWVAASPARRHLLAGAELADSWATDGHKWLNVPYDSGYAVTAHPDAHRAAMSHRASYLVETGEARDQMDWNPEWSRRARGVATYAAIRQLGRAGIAALVDRTSDHARAIVTGIDALPGAETVWVSEVNQGLVRFLDPRPNAAPADHDRRTDAVIAAIAASGEALCSGTTWRGMRCMRVSVCSWQTTTADVERTVAAAKAAIARVDAEAAAPLYAQ